MQESVNTLRRQSRRWNGGKGKRWKVGRLRGRKVESWKGGMVEGGKVER